MDVILKPPGDGSIEAHRSILAAMSPVFEKMLAIHTEALKRKIHDG